MSFARAARPWRRAALWLALLGPFFYLSYGLANHLAGLRSSLPSVVFEWERQLPFWPWTVFPYWSINAFYALSPFLCRNKHELDRHGLRLLTAQLGAVTFFLTLPLAFSFGQPAADGPAGLLFSALRGFDKPFNQAPSLHIALAVVLWDLYRRLIHARWARMALHGWTLLISASVLTTYQHHFIDIPTGALLGVLCVWLWPLERRLTPWRAWRWSASRERLRLGARYAAGSIAVFVLALWLGGAALWLTWMALALALVALNYVALGARGFAKHRHHGTPWPVRWLLAPYRWAAWLNSRWWTRRNPEPSAVADGVWLGRLPGAKADPRWASAVNLAAELDAPGRHPTLHVPAIDLVAPSAAWLLRAAWSIERQRAKYGSVLVYCALGYSRSAAAVAAWLLVHGRSTGLTEALAHLRGVRPQVVLGEAHVAALIEALQIKDRAA